MRPQSQHILLAAFLAAGLLAAPFGGLVAQSLPGDEFDPPLADVDALSPEERADVRAFAETMPEPGEAHAWIEEELNSEERVVQPPERQAADLYRTPMAPECALKGPGSVAVGAGSGFSFRPDPYAGSGRQCEAKLWPGVLRYRVQPLRAVSGIEFLLKNTYFSVRNGYVAPWSDAFASLPPRLPAVPSRVLRSAPLSVIVPTTVQTSPEFPV